MPLIQEKISQSIEILKEMDVDLWMIYCRESLTTPDPSMSLVVGHQVVGESIFLISSTGQTKAILAAFDTADFINANGYQEVIPYRNNITQLLLDNLNKLSPKRIAINYSENSSVADGLTHGMYLRLRNYLKDTPFANSLISAEPIIFKVRGRKSKSELTLLEKAAKIADECWQNSIQDIRTGMTEIEIAELITRNFEHLGATNSFGPIVNAGIKTSPGHGSPTEAVLEKGDLLHVDMGARYQGYVSDIQRMAYFKKDNESSAPNQLEDAFSMIKSVIDVTSRAYKTGAIGWEIDAMARKMLDENNFAEYNHCLGHQIGREVHDGASLVGPLWERYGKAPTIPLETSNVFTVELGVLVEGIGYASLEEDLVVTPEGGNFLCPRQLELIVK